MFKFLIILILLTNCIHMQQRAAQIDGVVPEIITPSPRCQTLASRVVWLHVLGIVFGGLGSVSAAVAPAINNTIGHDVLLGSGAFFAMGGAVTSYLGGVEAAAFSKECQ